MRMSTRWHRVVRRASRLALWAGFAVCALGSADGTVTEYVTGLSRGGGAYAPCSVFLNSKRGRVVDATATLRVYNLRPRRLTLRMQKSCGCNQTPWDTAAIVPFGVAALPIHAAMDGDAPLAQAELDIYTSCAAQPHLIVFFRNSDR